MSYCRFIEGDVYLYPSVSGPIICCACRLAEGDNLSFDTHDEALRHLEEHRAAGHDVPEGAFMSLRGEMADGD